MRLVHVAQASLVLGWSAIPLCMLSYSWMPFAATGWAMGPLFLVPLGAEIAALAAAIVAVVTGRLAVSLADVSATERARARRGVRLGAISLLLVVVPNLIGFALAR